MIDRIKGTIVSARGLHRPERFSYAGVVNNHQKEYLKLGDEKLTPVVPSEMEKIIRELPRDTEIQSSRFSKQNQRRMYDCKP